MNNENKPVLKKRGRKPKGGKIINTINNDTPIINQMIDDINILHLKCKKSDIKVNNYNPEINDIEPYSYDNCEYEILNHTKEINEEVKLFKSDEKEKTTIFNKLSELEKELHFNSVTKKSACFWCTCNYDTPTIYIPKMKIKKKYIVYGSFCSPECSCSYLFNESIVESIKYERYYLLNYIYGKIYDYTKDIKLAPSPFYLLDKYYGNLSIEEYRKLLTYDRILLFTDKPLTKNYPELHEDNNFEPLYNKVNMRKTKKIDNNEQIKQIFGTN